MVGEADVEMELVEDGEEDSEAVCVVVGDGVELQDPVIVAVRDVEGVGVAEIVEDIEELGVAVVELEELVELVAEIDGLLVVVGLGVGEGHTAHSAEFGVASLQRLNCRRPTAGLQDALRAVVVALQGPPAHVATQ